MNNERLKSNIYQKLFIIYLIPFLLSLQGCSQNTNTENEEFNYKPEKAKNQSYLKPPATSILGIENDGNWGVFSKQSGINAIKAWDFSMGNRQIVVAIVDTGLDIHHPFVKNSLWKGYEKGKVIHGWDMVTNSDFMEDDLGHGTHIAGIISGQIDMKNKISGIAPNVSIMPIRYYSVKGPSYGNLERAIKALNFAIDHGARIINYSGGGTDFSADEFNAIKRARDKGILVVAAAGNKHHDSALDKYYPANYKLDNIISVASINSDGEILQSSNYSEKVVDVAAPGENILSSVPTGYDYMTGTSQSTAFVSGIAALILSEKPDLSPQQVRAIIMNSVDKTSRLRHKVISGGKVNAFAAVKLALMEKRQCDIPDFIYEVENNSRQPALTIKYSK